jgi:hypothetical protein
MARYVLHLRCPQCQRGSYVAAPGALPQTCSACAGGSLRPVGVWDLVKQTRPPQHAS